MMIIKQLSSKFKNKYQRIIYHYHHLNQSRWCYSYHMILPFIRLFYLNVFNEMVIMRFSRLKRLLNLLF